MHRSSEYYRVDKTSAFFRSYLILITTESFERQSFPFRLSNDAHFFFVLTLCVSLSLSLFFPLDLSRYAAFDVSR